MFLEIQPGGVSTAVNKRRVRKWLLRTGPVVGKALMRSPYT